MRGLMTELEELSLHDMACAWEELVSQGTASTASSKWLQEHLLQQEHADRAVRSVNHQMNMAKLPMHRNLAGFDFSASSADARLVNDLSSLAFTQPRRIRVHRRPWKRENTPGKCLGCIRNHGPQQTRALLFHRGSGESAGT